MKKKLLLGLTALATVFGMTAKSQSEQGFYFLNTNQPSNVGVTTATLRGSFTTSDTVIIGFQMRPLDALFTSGDPFIGLTVKNPTFSDSVSQNVSGLYSNVPYYARIVMIRTDVVFHDTLYGNALAFTPTSNVVQAPVIGNLTFSTLTYNSVTISAPITTQGANTNWRILMGTTFPLPAVTAFQNMGSVSGPVSATISVPSNSTVQVQIEANNGQSTLSAPITIVTPSAPIANASCSTPTLVAATPTSLTLQAPIATNGSQTDYRVEYGVSFPLSSTTGWLSFGSVNGYATATLPNLQPNTQYILKFGCKNQTGVVMYTDEISPSTLAQTTTLAPTIQTSLSASQTSIQVNGTWGGAGAFPSVIKTEYATNASFNLPVITVGQTNYNTLSGVDMVSITGLQSGTQYWVRQIITNANGADTTVTTTTTTSAQVAPSVSNLLVASSSIGSIIFSLNVVLGSTSTAMYEVEGSQTQNFSTAITTFPSGQGSFVATGTQSVSVNDPALVAGSTWYFRVIVTNTVGTATSNVVSETFQTQIGVPAASSLTVSSVTTSGFTGTFTWSSGGVTTNVVTQLEVSSDNFVSYTVYGSTPQTTTTGTYAYTTTGLASGTYSVRGRIQNGSGNDTTNTLPVVIAEQPILPTIVSVSLVDTTNDGGNISVQYNGNEQAVQLMLYHGLTSSLGDSLMQIGVPGVGNANFSLTGYPSGTLVYYRVKAMNLVGATWGTLSSFTTSDIIVLTPPSIVSVSASGNANGGKIIFSYASSNPFNGWGEVTKDNFNTITSTDMITYPAGARIDTILIPGPLSNGTYKVRPVGYVLNSAPVQGAVKTFTVGTTTGIDDQLKSIRVSGVCEVFSIQGQHIGTYKVTSQSSIVDVIPDAPGVYTYQIVEGSERLGSGKVFVQ